MDELAGILGLVRGHSFIERYKFGLQIRGATSRFTLSFQYMRLLCDKMADLHSTYLYPMIYERPLKELRNLVIRF